MYTSNYAIDGINYNNVHACYCFIFTNLTRGSLNIARLVSQWLQGL